MNQNSSVETEALVGRQRKIIIDRLSSLLDSERVVYHRDALDRYAHSLSGSDVHPLLIVYPDNDAQIVALLALANELGFHLYPISRGKNYGYGSAQATSPGQVIVDMSCMDKVLEHNEELGYVTVQSGISQGALYRYLQQQGSRLQLDVTGAGDEASVVGNVLERGFGHTDYGDRYSSVLAMKLYLADGRCVQTGFGEFPNAQAARSYRHGIGPSVDGLFTQSNLGIVTQMTLALQPKAEVDCMFIYISNTDQSLESIVDSVRELRLRGVVNSAVHIANKERLAKPQQKNNAGEWNVSGSISGPRSLVSGKKREVNKQFASIPGGRLIWITDFRLKILGFVHRHIFQLPLYLDLRNAFGLKQGIPTEVYIQDFMQDKLASSGDLRIENNQRRFMWVSAVCPADPVRLRELQSLTKKFMTESGYVFRVTFTFISPRSLIMITEFSYSNNSEELEQAHTAYSHCVSMLNTAGYYAYRSGPESYRKNIPQHTMLLDMCRDIKQALDPNNIIAPGKYSV